MIGREAELALLQRRLNSPVSEFVAVYGRRGVGKTYLVHQLLGERPDFEYTGSCRAGARVQLKQFHAALKRRGGGDTKIPQSWFEAFSELKQYLLGLGKDKVVVFLDELPWMATAKSSFKAALAYFWNGWNSNRTLLKLVACGSSITWMTDKLLGDPGGLYGRVSRAIYLAPFTLRETELYLNEVKGLHYGREQVLECYLSLGGIPYYLEQLKAGKSLEHNLGALFGTGHSPLGEEFEFLYRSLFRNSNKYLKVVEYLARSLSGRSREEIARACRLTGGELSILAKLCKEDFLRAFLVPYKKERGRIYHLCDQLSLFYLSQVKAERSSAANFRMSISQSDPKEAWADYAFTQVCLQHLPQIRQALGITGVLSKVYAWSVPAPKDETGSVSSATQPALIIDRADSVMNFCEMKYSHDEYGIDTASERSLRERMAQFRRSVSGKKTVRCTLITPYGVRQDEHSALVAAQVLLDDLFCEVKPL